MTSTTMDFITLLYGTDITCNLTIQDPEIIFVTGLVKFVTALARLVYPDLLG